MWCKPPGGPDSALRDLARLAEAEWLAGQAGSEGGGREVSDDGSEPSIDVGTRPLTISDRTSREAAAEDLHTDGHDGDGEPLDETGGPMAGTIFRVPSHPDEPDPA